MCLEIACRCSNPCYITSIVHRECIRTIRGVCIMANVKTKVNVLGEGSYRKSPLVEIGTSGLGGIGTKKKANFPKIFLVFDAVVYKL
jgi:hypothetical protein